MHDAPRAAVPAEPLARILSSTDETRKSDLTFTISHPPEPMQLWRPSSLLYRSNHCVASRTSIRVFSAAVNLALAKTSKDGDTKVSRTRNIGIIAHIDAVSQRRSIDSIFARVADILKGKTTTTERMLYYSGHTRRIGSKDTPF